MRRARRQFRLSLNGPGSGRGMRLPQLFLRLVYRAQKLRIIGRLVHGPQSIEGLSEALHIAKSQQAYSHYALVGHIDPFF